MLIIMWSSSYYHLTIIEWSQLIKWWFIIDQQTNNKGNKQTNKQTNMLNMMSMWLSCDYHKMIIVCSFNDHLMIFWLPYDDHNNYHHLVIKNWYVNHHQHVVIKKWCVNHHHQHHHLVIKDQCVNHLHPHHHVLVIEDLCVNHHYHHNSNHHYLVIKDRCVNHIIIM